MHHLHFFELNGNAKWIEPSVDPNAVQSQLRPGIIFQGELQETNNTLQVYSNPKAQTDDFRIYYILIFYHTRNP